MIRQLLAAIALTLVFGAGHARSTQMVETGRVLLPEVGSTKLSAEHTRSVIIKAALEIGWTVVKDEPGLIHLRYSKGNGKHVAVLAVPYDAKGFEVKYLDSTNLNYDAAAGTIHPTYNMWVNNIVRKTSAAHASSSN